MAAEDQVVLLRDIRNLLLLAFSDKVKEIVAELRSDKVNAAILDALTEEGELATTSLQQRIAGAQQGSERTVQRRIADLASRGIVEIDGSRRPPVCRLTGLLR